MYTLRITDDNEVITKPEVIMEKSNAVDQIRILVDKKYKGQIDMSDATVYMKYTLPISKKIKTKIKLIPNEDDYNDDILQFFLPSTVDDFTSEAGDIEVSFTFIKLVQNIDDTFIPYDRKTTSGIIHITPLSSFDKFDVSEYFDDFDQRIIEQEKILQEMRATANAMYNGMVKDIRINAEDRKVILTNRDGKDTGEGIEINNLSTFIAEELTGKDPDGIQDGVVNLDQVSGTKVMSLDELLK